MNICFILGEYNNFDANCIKEIKQAKRICKPDLMCVLLNKNIKNDGTFLISNQVDLENDIIDGGADLVLAIPSLFTLCKKDLLSLALLKIINLFGSNNTFNFACPVLSEDMEDINMAEDLLSSEGNDSFLVGNNVLKINKTESNKNADISNMLTGLNNEILVQTYYKAKEAKLNVNLIPILKYTEDDDTNDSTLSNKFNLLTTKVLSSTNHEKVQTILEYVSDPDTPEVTARKIGIPLLLHLDITKNDIINSIIKLDSVQMLAVKKNKQKLIDNKKFNEGSEIYSYDDKIKELFKLLS
ncbi:MAG: nucleotidyltransferase family protein [Clostridia bacterium]|nr:nucleotidyltransferase family protein [Clostridia bacterium]